MRENKKEKERCNSFLIKFTRPVRCGTTRSFFHFFFLPHSWCSLRGCLKLERWNFLLLFLSIRLQKMSELLEERSERRYPKSLLWACCWSCLVSFLFARLPAVRSTECLTCLIFLSRILLNTEFFFFLALRAFSRSSRDSLSNDFEGLLHVASVQGSISNDVVQRRNVKNKRGKNGKRYLSAFQFWCVCRAWRAVLLGILSGKESHGE